MHSLIRLPGPCIHAVVLMCSILCTAATSADISNGIYKIRHTSIRKKCRLFIGVPSASKDRRDAIRETWGRHALEHPDVVLHFYAYQHDGGGTGLLLDREALQHRDLIIIRNEHLSDAALENDQEGVTQKVYFMMLHAVTTFEPQYIMKADDDTYVNLPAVMRMLLHFPTNRALYAGHQRFLDVNDDSDDDRSGLMAQYMAETAGRPPCNAYMEGPAYILSKGAVEAIVAVNNAVGLRFMHHEDLAVGLWVSGLYIKHVKQDDENGPRTINLGRASAAELKVINVTQSYCPDAKKPVSWIHPLKLPQYMHAISRIANACTSI